jgi:hypothetical protein
MIIGDFGLECVAIMPNEAYSELIIDPDTMLSCTVALQRFQPIAGKKCQVREHSGSVNLDEFPLDNLSEPVVAFGISAVKNELRISGSKRPDHESHCMTLYVSRQGRKFPMPTPALR